MRRVVFLGRGAAGKSTAALALGELTGLPVSPEGPLDLTG